MSNQFVNKLKDLREIQPNIEWQRATRVELLERFDSLQEPQRAGFFSLSFSYRPVLVTIVILAVIFGGSWLIFRDLSYPLDLAEKGAKMVSVFNSQERASRQVEETNEEVLAKRLEEKIIQVEEDIGSLPVRDNKEIIAFTFEAKKALEEAKVYLLEKNFTMALSKIEEGEELVEKAREEGTASVWVSPKHEVVEPDFKIDIIKE